MEGRGRNEDRRPKGGTSSAKGSSVDQETMSDRETSTLRETTWSRQGGGGRIISQGNGGGELSEPEQSEGSQQLGEGTQLGVHAPELLSFSELVYFSSSALLHGISSLLCLAVLLTYSPLLRPTRFS